MRISAPPTKHDLTTCHGHELKTTHPLIEKPSKKKDANDAVYQ